MEKNLQRIKRDGDEAVHALSMQFDRYVPESFRLGSVEIAVAVAQVSPDDLEDIRFAQAQERNFAEGPMS